MCNAALEKRGALQCDRLSDLLVAFCHMRVADWMGGQYDSTPWHKPFNKSCPIQRKVSRFPKNFPEEVRPPGSFL